MRLAGRAATLACMALLAAAPAAHARAGALTQLKGSAGCIAASDLIPGCAHARFGGGQIVDVAVSPDNRNVYVAGLGGGVTVFAIRHGALRQLRGRAGCVSGSGSHGCARMPELFKATKIVVSPDGRNVYVGSADRTRQFGGVVAFARDRTSGALRRLSHRAACMGERGPTCAPVRDIFAGVRDLAITPDGRSLYVGSNDAAPGGATRGAVAIFGRNPATGRLSQPDGLPGCLNHRGGDGCRAAKGLLADCCSIAATDRSVYAASDDGQSVAISAFERDPNSEVLVQLPAATGCIGADVGAGCGTWNLGSLASSNTSGELVFGPRALHLYFGHAFVAPSSGGGGCGEQVAVIGASPSGGGLGGVIQDVSGCAASLATSPDRRSLYGTSDFAGQISIFRANAVTGDLTRRGCVGQFSPGCTRARELEFPAAVAVAPGGRLVYVAAASTLGIFTRSLR